jgi:hypothetical protein
MGGTPYTQQKFFRGDPQYTTPAPSLRLRREKE